MVMKSKLSGETLEYGRGLRTISGGGDFDYEEMRVAQLVWDQLDRWMPYRTNPFRTHWLNYWIRRPVTPQQEEMAGRCLAIVARGRAGHAVLAGDPEENGFLLSLFS